MGTNNTIFYLQLATGIISALILLLGGILILLIYKNKQAKTESDETKLDENGKPIKKEKADLGKVSIKKFMEFDDVIDNMIVRKNRQQYVMVIKCKGVNYDLLSEAEKMAVENGFTQFLNTLRFPIQLYVQTRSLNLKDIIDSYGQKVDSFRQEVDSLDVRIKKAKLSGNKELQERLEFDRRRKANVLEYGTDITDYIGKLSLNKNVLQQNTYVVVSYFSSEIGTEINNYSKSEIDGMCFNELYIRAQGLISALATAEVYGRILNSEELAELLYVAYNREDSEIMTLRKALDAEYDSFYSTAPDVMQKKIEKLEKEIEEDATILATESMIEADRLRLLERRRKYLTKSKALEMVEEYKDEVDKDLYEKTKEQIEKYDTSDNEERKDELKKDESSEEKQDKTLKVKRTRKAKVD